MNSVEKEAVLHCLKTMIDEAACEECPLYGTTGTDHCEKDCVRLAINALSSLEKPKTGQWISYNWNDNGIARWGIKCNQCYKEYRYGGEMGGTYKYCPNCGAKMQELQESEVQG